MMRITCRETLTRFKTITVPDAEITDEDCYETDEIREQMWKQTADDGWDHEYVTEATFYEGEGDDTICYQG
jgi:hypothetical protein